MTKKICLFPGQQHRKKSHAHAGEAEMMREENLFLKTLLSEERSGKRKLEEEMSAVLREIRAFMQTGNEGIFGLTRFFRKGTT